MLPSFRPNSLQQKHVNGFPVVCSLIASIMHEFSQQKVCVEGNHHLSFPLGFSTAVIPKLHCITKALLLLIPESQRVLNRN